jgi:hypothetical protein
MLRPTRTNNKDPYLVISHAPPGTTGEQLARGFEAARKVFEDAGYDPVQVGMADFDDAFENRFFTDLWKAAEKAATVACWAPRAGEPKPTEISIYFKWRRDDQAARRKGARFNPPGASRAAVS